MLLLKSVKFPDSNFVNFPKVGAYGELPRKENEILISSMAKVDGDYFYKKIDFSKSKKQKISLLFNGKEQKFTVTGILDDFDAGAERQIQILGYKEKVENPIGAYYVLEYTSRSFLREFAERQGFDYDTQVYDTELFAEGGKSGYGGDYPVLLNNYVINILNHGGSDGEIRLIRQAVLAIVFCILLVSMFMIGSVYAIDLEFRKTEIALLRICGYSRWMVLRFLCLKSIVQAGMGYLFSVMALAGLHPVLQKVVFLVGGEEFSNLRIILEPNIFGAVFLLIFLFVPMAAVTPIAGPIMSAPVAGFQKKIRRFRWLPDSKFFAMTASLSLCVAFFLVFLGMKDVMGQQAAGLSEEYRSEFTIMAEKIPKIKKLRANIPFVSEFEVIYDKIGTFLLDKDSWNKKYESFVKLAGYKRA